MTEIIKWCNDNQGFLSAVISVVAVFAAICIPAYIAHKQDKIALFEKRFLVLECLGNVLRFSDDIKPENMEGENLGDVPELKVWTVTQVNDGGLTDEISFMPYPGKILKIATKEDIRRDVHILRKKLSFDYSILTQGCPIFREPIRSEFELLKESYMRYVLSLLCEYGDIPSELEPSVILKRAFLFNSDKFKDNSKLMRSIVRSIKI